MKKFLYILLCAFVFLAGFYIYLIFDEEKDPADIYSLRRWLGSLIALCGFLLVVIYLLLAKFREKNTLQRKKIADDSFF
ncbi:hypothetical protein [Bacteroidetes bacterium endosymbiont of Geopemphigus sp.]|uniref:hypothetical protein n=1 Tax=Bacteroidetes bacterium endosymbiont of Geopemphigus sp. TaxID=2047937 RepID=UPI000CD2F911|nr:hypothetical protein [Bacteroidetes bacterium endosymbiont of Geopemphigus sp.]